MVKLTAVFTLIVSTFLMTLAGGDEFCNSESEDCPEGQVREGKASSKEKPGSKSSKAIWERLEATLGDIRRDCGELCDVAKEGKPGKYYQEIEKEIDCR